MLSKSQTLTLMGFFIAGPALFAGPVDDVRSAVAGPLADSFKEALNLLEKDNTLEAKKHLMKMKDILGDVDGLFHTTESILEGIDPKLKAQWADLYRLEQSVNISAGVVTSELGVASYKSDLAQLKGHWEKFSTEVPKVYAAFVEYGKTAVKFQNLCAGCR
jgi:hypothetical protein